ncbi:MAG: hypothetical protein IJQ20_05855 [Paludibacteraceae bacterium]|nr:hypothetical protein [Paludibacteraceae bacterium]
MKNRCSITILLLACWIFAFPASNNTVPAGETLYLYVSSYWPCYASYLLYSSHWQRYEVMTPVAGKPGLYQYTFTSSFSKKVYFGATTQVITTGADDWIGFCDVKTKELEFKWTAETPCFIIDDISGSGYWGAVPDDIGSSPSAVIESVTYEIVSSCVTETYNITITASFSGEPCSYKMTGTEFKRDIIRSSPVSPVTYTIKNLPAKTTPEEESVTFSLCSDGSGTAIISSQTVTYTSPTLDCEVLHDPIEVCNGFPDITLEASMEGDSYLWSTGETTRSISVPSNTSATYSVEVYAITHSAIDNLMANGDFETVPVGNNPPEGFTSSYNYVGAFDPSQYYNSHGGASNIYAITHNASYFWKDFADIEPQEGNYYALFDAGKSGYAWKATTIDNTSLTVEKDSVYLFSYWAAYPNIAPDRSPAMLQFRISYTDPDGVVQTQNLGQVYELGQESDLNAWYYQEIQWKAPSNSNSVTISVEDLNSASSGNDFCLDNILFQRTTVGRSVLAKKDIFPVISAECDVVLDTICLGERYIGHGFDFTPMEAGIQVYPIPETQSTLSLLVTEPVQAAFASLEPFCNFEGGQIDLPFTVQKGEPYSYSLNSNNPAIETKNHEVLGNVSYITLSVEGSISGQVDLDITLFDESGKCEPFNTNMSLDFQSCNYQTDTVCTGEAYLKNGYEHPADQPGSYMLKQGTDSLLLTVIESIDITIQPPAPLCNVAVDTILTVSYTIVSGSPKTYSLYFDTHLMKDVENVPLQGNRFSILLPAEVDQTVTVTFYTEEETGHCAYEKQFSIGRNAGATIYRKWDDVLFVDNGDNEYVAYQWYCDGVAINGAITQDYYIGSSLDNDGHSYYVVMTRADGTTAITCPMTFGEAAPSTTLNPGDHQSVPYQVRHFMVGPHMDIMETVYDDGSVDVQKRIIQ